MNKKIVRKPRNIYINPDVLYEARVKAVRARKTLGQWVEDAIEEKLAREEAEEKHS